VKTFSELLTIAFEFLSRNKRHEPLLTTFVVP